MGCSIKIIGFLQSVSEQKICFIKYSKLKHLMKAARL